MCLSDGRWKGFRVDNRSLRVAAPIAAQHSQQIYLLWGKELFHEFLVVEDGTEPLAVELAADVGIDLQGLAEIRDRSGRASDNKRLPRCPREGRPDRKSTRLNSSHSLTSRMPSSA